MKWLKLWNKARVDSALETLSDSEFRTWFRLLCFANEQPERGVIRLGGRKLAAEVSRGDTKLLNTTLRALVELEIITHENGVIRFTNWDKHQRKPSDAPEAVAERVRRHRERKRGIPTEVTEPRTEVVLHRRAPSGRAKLELIYQGITHNRVTDEDRADMDAMIELAGLDTCIRVLKEIGERANLQGWQGRKPYKFAYFTQPIRQAAGKELAEQGTAPRYRIADEPPEDWGQTG